MDKILLADIADLWYHTPEGYAYLLTENERLKNEYEKLIKEKGEIKPPPPKRIEYSPTKKGATD